MPLTPKAGTAMSRVPLFEVRDLSIGFQDADTGELTAVTDKVGFSIEAGESYGLVGESGCGKSVTALSILRLLPTPSAKILSGEILFKGRDILRLSQRELRQVRGRQISMIFQEPGQALNPLERISSQLKEAFRYHKTETRPLERIRFLLNRVGFSEPDRVLNAFPHELSGGMLQRVMIAMALLFNPDLLIADEPTTALDVTVQANVMELLEELRKDLNVAVLLITHDLNVVAQYTNRVGVMYAGRLVEEAGVAELFNNPRHPYAWGLLKALPSLEGKRELSSIPGTVPPPSEFPQGCRFRPRCPNATKQCESVPEYRESNGRRLACFHPTGGENA